MTYPTLATFRFVEVETLGAWLGVKRVTEYQKTGNMAAQVPSSTDLATFNSLQ